MFLISLQSKLVLNVLRRVFDDATKHHISHHQGLQGVKTSENGLFLYKSTQADALIRSRVIDYAILGFFTA